MRKKLNLNLFFREYKRQLSFGEDHEDDLVHVDGENTSAAETEKIIV